MMSKLLVELRCGRLPLATLFSLFQQIFCCCFSSVPLLFTRLISSPFLLLPLNPHPTPREDFCFASLNFLYVNHYLKKWEKCYIKLYYNLYYNLYVILSYSLIHR